MGALKKLSSYVVYSKNDSKIDFWLQRLSFFAAFEDMNDELEPLSIIESNQNEEFSWLVAMTRLVETLAVLGMWEPSIDLRFGVDFGGGLLVLNGLSALFLGGFGEKGVLVGVGEKELVLYFVTVVFVIGVEVRGFVRLFCFLSLLHSLLSLFLSVL